MLSNPSSNRMLPPLPFCHRNFCCYEAGVHMKLAQIRLEDDSIAKSLPFLTRHNQLLISIVPDSATRPPDGLDIQPTYHRTFYTWQHFPCI
jgi:hypothetical protein